MDERDICENRHQGNEQSLAAHERGKVRRPAQRTQIYRCLHERGPMTCEQVSITLQMRYTSVSARLSEMKRDGLVMDSGKTQKTTGGEQAALIQVV